MIGGGAVVRTPDPHFDSSSMFWGCRFMVAASGGEKGNWFESDLVDTIHRGAFILKLKEQESQALHLK